MSKVFIVQELLRRDKDSGQLVPMMDLRSTMEYGEVVICLESGRISLSPVPMIMNLRKVLEDFSDDDYLVPVGDPCAIAVAAGIALANNRGKMNLLKWDKKYRRYIKVAINIYPQNKE